MWVSRPLFSECERWKYILKTFFCHLFWKWQWPIYVGCISLCILSSMSFYWMLQCHHVLLLSTCSCFRTIFNRKKLLFSVSLFLFPKEDCVCRKTSNAEALLLIMKDIKNRVVGRRKEKKKKKHSVPFVLILVPFISSKFLPFQSLPYHFQICHYAIGIAKYHLVISQTLEITFSVHCGSSNCN